MRPILNIPRAIAMARPPERRLYRWESNRWSGQQPSLVTGSMYPPDPWVGTRTILEMIRLGVAEVTERRGPGRPIVVRIVTRRNS
jgi:hypothetical protein